MAQTVVEQLLIELKARTDQAETRLAAVDRQLDRTAKKGREAGAAAGQLGGKYAGAAQQMASAAENMARSGQVTGDAAKQMIQQGAGMAMMFGAAGPIVGAAAIAGLAIYELFNRTRKEIEETRKKAEDEYRRLKTGKSLGATTDRLVELYSGNEFGESEAERAGIANLEARARGLRQKLAGLSTATSVSGAGSEELEAIRERNRLNSEYSGELQEIERQLGQLKPQYERLGSLAKEQAASAVAISQNSVAQDAREQAAAEAKRAGERAARQAEQAAEARMRATLAQAKSLSDQLRESGLDAQRFGEEAEAALVKLTPSTVDDLTAAIAELDERLAKRRVFMTPEEIKNAEKWRAALVGDRDAAQALDALRPKLEGIDKVLAGMARRRSSAAADGATFAPTADEQKQLADYRSFMQRVADDETQQDSVRKMAAEALLKVESEIAGIRGAAAKDSVPVLAQVAGHLQAAANAGVALAAALGDGNGELARMLAGVGSVAGGIEGLAAAAAKKDAAGNAPGLSGLFSTSAGLATAIPLVGQILGGLGAMGGLFGDSPAEQERKRIHEENTEALRELTVKVGTLNVTGTGENRRKAVGAASALLEGGYTGITISDSLRKKDDGRVRRALEDAGLSMDAFREQAERLGITLSDRLTREQLQAIVDAAASAGILFQEMEAGWRVLETSAMDQLAQFAAFTTTNPAFGEAVKGILGGLDLATQEGRDEAIAQVRAAFSGKQISAELAEQLIGLLKGASDEIAQQAAEEAARIAEEFAKARAARAEAVGRARSEDALYDRDGAGQSLSTLTTAYAEQIPVLAQLTEGLDLTTREGLATFDERLQRFYEGIRDGSIVVDGFDVDEITDALFVMEDAGDAAAAAIKASADALRDYTLAMEDDLAVRELLADGDQSGADMLSLTNRHEAERDEAIAKGVSVEMLAWLDKVQDKEVAALLASQVEADAALDDPRTGPSSTLARAGAASVDTLIGIAHTGLALDRERNAMLAQLVRSLTTGALPVIQPPAIPFAGVSAAGSGSSSGSNAAGGIVVHQTVQFYGPVTGVEEVRSAVRAGGRDIAAELQRELETRRSVEGRAEVL